MRFLMWMYVVLFISAYPAYASERIQMIQRDGQLCANALINHDIDSLIRFTHPVVITMSGGREGFIHSILSGVQDMENQGVSFVSAMVEKPVMVKKIRETTYAILPQTIIMSVPGGTLISDGHLLAVSSGSIEGWSFVDMAPLDNTNIATVFPDLAGKVEVPEKQDPTFIPNQNPYTHKTLTQVHANSGHI